MSIDEIEEHLNRRKCKAHGTILPMRLGEEIKIKWEEHKMTDVNTIEDAEEWFMSNSSGEINCIKGSEEKVCSSYPEAVMFFSGGDI